MLTKPTNLIAVALILFAGAWILHSRVQFAPSLTTEMTNTASAQADDAPVSTQQKISTSESTAARQAPNPLDNFATEFKKCFPDSLAVPVSSADWLAEADRNREVESRSVSVENIHRKDPKSGQERRLQILNIGPKAEVREFDVDEEGLPVPVGQLRALALADTALIRDDFLRQGELIFAQRKETWQFKSGLQGEIEWENEKPRDLQVFGNGVAFYCRAADCSCHSD